MKIASILLFLYIAIFGKYHKSYHVDRKGLAYSYESYKLNPFYLWRVTYEKK